MLTSAIVAASKHILIQMEHVRVTLKLHMVSPGRFITSQVGQDGGEALFSKARMELDFYPHNLLEWEPHQEWLSRLGPFALLNYLH